MTLKKILKALLYLASSIVALVVVALIAIYSISSYRLQRKHVIQAQGISIPSSSVALERGRHLVTTRGCAECHDANFGGGKVIDDPLAGVFHAPNLTHGVGGLPADYSDLDYVRAIRHGVARDGRPFVLMPSAEYSALTDEDLGSIIAYLKSMPAVDRPRGPISPGPIIRLLLTLGQMKLAAEEIDHQAVHVSAIAPAISAEYGKYVASSCVGCHGSNMSGGKIPGGPPDWPAAANLTPHSSARIASWSETQFVQVIRTRQRPDGSALDQVMPAAFSNMSDLELKALWAYFSKLPPVATGVR